MYHAKREGKGVEVYDAAVAYEGRDRLRRVADLQRALEVDELVLHFQPIVHAGSGAVTGAEALLRWQHPEQGLLGPGAFLPLVAEAGLIESVTRVVVEQAVAELARWRSVGLDLCLAINVTAADLLGDRLVTTIEDALRHHGVDPRRLIVEITEESFVADLPRAARTVDRLRGAGMAVAVDDFGVGFSSLSQLQHLVVDELKLDRSLTSAFTSNPRAGAVVRSAVLLAHGLGMTVVAEGVEDVETWRALASAGCDLIQGYLVARPMPAEQFAAWLSTARTGVVEAVEAVEAVAAGDVQTVTTR